VKYLTEFLQIPWVLYKCNFLERIPTVQPHQQNWIYWPSVNENVETWYILQFFGSE